MKLGATALFLVTTPLPAANAAELDGWYGGLELGGAMFPEVSISGRDNDFEDSVACDGSFSGIVRRAGTAGPTRLTGPQGSVPSYEETSQSQNKAVLEREGIHF